MGKVTNDLRVLENGEIPKSMNFTIEDYINDKSIAEQITYKTFTEQFVFNYYDPELLALFPSLQKLALEEYERYKYRTPLQEMLELQRASNQIKSNDILYDN